MQAPQSARDEPAPSGVMSHWSASPVVLGACGTITRSRRCPRDRPRGEADAGLNGSIRCFGEPLGDGEPILHVLQLQPGPLSQLFQVALARPCIRIETGGRVWGIGAATISGCGRQLPSPQRMTIAADHRAVATNVRATTTTTTGPNQIRPRRVPHAEPSETRPSRRGGRSRARAVRDPRVQLARE